MFIDKLYEIMNDLNSCKSSPEELYVECVKTRLEDNLLNYCKELDDSISYLSHRRNSSVLKRISNKL